MRRTNPSENDLIENWAKYRKVYVNEADQEVDWLYNKDGTWKPLWIMEKFWRYTAIVCPNSREEQSEFNFRCDSNLAPLVADIWFGEVERIGRAQKICGLQRDNKTVIQLRNRLTNQVIYMGWYDRNFIVSPNPPHITEHEPILLKEEWQH